MDSATPREPKFRISLVTIHLFKETRFPFSNVEIDTKIVFIHINIPTAAGAGGCAGEALARSRGGESPSPGGGSGGESPPRGGGGGGGGAPPRGLTTRETP